jgi:hypothetical protein
MPVAVVQLCNSIVMAADRTKQDSRILVANGMEIIVHERHDSERARRETRDDRLSLLERERSRDRINDDLIVVTVLLIAPAASTVCQLQVLYTVVLA